MKLLALVFSAMFLLASFPDIAEARSSKRSGRVSVKRKAYLKAGKKRVRAKVKRISRREVRYLLRLRALDNSLLRISEEEIMKDDLSGEDREMRRAALKALGGHPGTVVLMNPNNGRVYSIVNQAWAVGKPFKPCSTIKLLTSVAALGEGLVDPDKPMDLGYGLRMNMIEALARSNNEYFQVLGDQLGYEILLEYAREWGLGQLTGINLAGEVPGYLPTENNFSPRVCSHGDGIGITAIQLAVMTAAIANGGKIYQPQIVRSEREEAEFQPRLLRTVRMDEKARQKLIEGMLGAVTFGSARRCGAAHLGVAGKTGSCTGQESKLGLFASFFSPEKPDLVAVVITTGSSERGSQTSVFAGQIYNEIAAYFGDRPKLSLTARKLDELDLRSEEEDEEEEDEEDIQER
ncbi:MAG: penicillin-binding transpeptidase domain-containing protein [Acidobacteriota bacterium]|nr:penicillin-binding transpeptidase domain-containing protein [Blastocatellia bacterium]MDW8412578.1 penicillin-binding transpeptidase domain-containing protein [Acidobacteriota bacterium]